MNGESQTVVGIELVVQPTGVPIVNIVKNPPLANSTGHLEPRGYGYFVVRSQVGNCYVGGIIASKNQTPAKHPVTSSNAKDRAIQILSRIVGCCSVVKGIGGDGCICSGVLYKNGKNHGRKD